MKRTCAVARQWLPAMPPVVLLLAALASAAPVAAQSAHVPTPAEVFGFAPGADYHLATYEQVADYFHKLAAASDRVKVEQIGTTVQGRPLLLAFVSSAENIRNLEHYRRISEQLARGTVDSARAARLADEGKAIVWIDGGLHATEVAPGQETPLIAYDIATGETPEIRNIRQNVIFLVMPNLNPDGLDMVARWYRRNLGTPFETAPMPWLFHPYVGHDNNRDWYTMFMPESRAVARVLYQDWYPQIVYNQHQTAPFPARIFEPPFADPVNPNIPPLVTRGVNIVGAAMNQRFEQKHMSGAVSHIGFDMWWNGGMRSAPYYHNMVGILTETALYRYATPHYYPPDSLPRTFGRQSNMSASQPSIFYPDPWKGGWWRLRDAVDYVLTSDMAVLKVGAQDRHDWLLNAYIMARDAIDKGHKGGPFAYVVPPGQWNPDEAVEMVNMLRRGGVDVARATQPFQAAGTSFPAGSYVIFAAQAFRPYIVDLLEKQVYPDMRLYPGGPPDRPYDITGWTLPMQMHVRVMRVDRPFHVATTPVDHATVWPGTTTGTGDWGYALSHNANASAIAVNRLLRAGERVSWTTKPVELAGRSWPAGTIVIRRRGGTAARVAGLARDLGLDFTALSDAPAAAGLERLRRARVALYKSWVANMAEGWTRWILEQYEFPFDTLHDADIRGGALRRYDVLLLPDQRESAMLNGHAAGTLPAEYTGGLGATGAAAIERFVAAGGTVVAVDHAADFAIDQLGLPVRDALGAGGGGVFIPGSILRLSVDPTDPVTYGMPAAGVAYFANSRAFRVIPSAREGSKVSAPQPATVPARYADHDLLMSGWALGAKRLADAPAVVRVRHGKGNVVLIGFRAQFRAQPRGTFKLLFNAIQASTLGSLPYPSGSAGGNGGASR